MTEEEGKYFTCGEVISLSIGNDELEDSPKIEVGDLTPCPKCGEMTVVKDSEFSRIQYVSHCETDWLVGLNNKFIGKKNEKE